MKKRNKKGFVISALLYPVLIIGLALVMGILSMTDARKRILDKMKLEIAGSIFDEDACSCDTILNKLNYIIKNGVAGGGGFTLNITEYETYSAFPMSKNQDNDIAIVSSLPIMSSSMSATQPTSAQQGDLWICIKSGTSVTFDESVFKIPIAYIKQYNGSSWVNVDAAIWKDNSWKRLNDTVLETASPSTILKNYTAIVNGVKVTGTLDLSGTASASTIKKGYTAWVNGSKVTGSLIVDEGSYFKIDSDSKDVYLGGKKVTVEKQNATTAKDGRMQEKLVVSRPNKSNVVTSLVLYTEVLGNSDALSNSDPGTASWTDKTVNVDDVIQVSPYVVAVFWHVDSLAESYTNIYQLPNSCGTGTNEVESYTTTSYYYVSTFYLKNDTLTNTVTASPFGKQLNAQAETDKNYSITKYSGSYCDNLYTGNNQYRNYSYEIKEDFSNNLTARTAPIKYYQFLESTTLNFVYHGEDTSGTHNYNTHIWKLGGFGIDAETGAISVLAAENVKSGNQTENEFTGKLDTTISYETFEYGFYGTTFSAKPEYQDTCTNSWGASSCGSGTETTTTVYFPQQTSGAKAITIAGANFSNTDYYKKLMKAKNRYTGRASNWYFDYKPSMSGKTFTLSLDSMLAGSYGVLLNDDSSTIRNTSVSIDLSSAFPNTSYFSTSCQYSSNLGKIFCTVSGSGKVYIIVGLKENDFSSGPHKLGLVLESVSYRTSENGTLRGSEAMDSLSHKAIKFYK